MHKTLILAMLLFISCSSFEVNKGDVVFVENWGKALRVEILENLPEHKVVKVKITRQDIKYGTYLSEEYWTYDYLQRSLVK